MGLYDTVICKHPLKNCPEPWIQESSFQIKDFNDDDDFFFGGSLTITQEGRLIRHLILDVCPYEHIQDECFECDECASTIKKKDVDLHYCGDLTIDTGCNIDDTYHYYQYCLQFKDGVVKYCHMTSCDKY